MKKIVTPEQLADGWLQLYGGAIYTRSFSGVVKRPDGNYEVDDPAAVWLSLPAVKPRLLTITGHHWADEQPADEPTIVE